MDPAFRVAGDRQTPRHGLGAYPAPGIAAARKVAFDAREIVAAGSDPIETRRRTEEAKGTQSAVPTFRQAAELVHAAVSPGFRNAKHAAQWINTLDDHVFPAIGHRLVSELKPRDFADALHPIWLSKPETATRVRQRCDAVMKWCAARDYVSASPFSAVDALLPRQPGKRGRVRHHPAAPWRDLPAVAKSLLHDQPSTTGRKALEFTILTNARSGEVRGMTWDEVDFDNRTWTVPAKRMKAKATHRVPLCEPALTILHAQSQERCSSPFIFPSRRDTPISDMTLTKVLRDARIAYPRDLADKALAHTIKNATEAAYHRTDLFEARKPMMVKWGAFVGSACQWLPGFSPE